MNLDVNLYGRRSDGTLAQWALESGSDIEAARKEAQALLAADGVRKPVVLALLTRKPVTFTLGPASV